MIGLRTVDVWVAGRFISLAEGDIELLLIAAVEVAVAVAVDVVDVVVVVVVGGSIGTVDALVDDILDIIVKIINIKGARKRLKYYKNTK